MHQIQPQKEKRYTACSRRLDKIKQVFFALQAVYFCDDYHRTLDSKCAERQHEINRPATPACEVIPEHRQDRDKKQLPHLIFEDVAAFGVATVTIAHAHRQPAAANQNQFSPSVII